MKATEVELSRMQIRSPAAGQVIALAIRNPGGVVQHGQPLMDIVPQGSALVLDVKVPPTAISQVAVGNAVEVRFPAFAHKPHLVVMGKLTSLSTDVVSEQVAGMVSSHYTGQAVLTPEGMKALGSDVVQPGMPAEVLIRTGERSMLSYLFGPLVKRVAVALTEQ
jgi:protease secretion system membrane fusion protein